MSTCNTTWRAWVRIIWVIYTYYYFSEYKITILWISMTPKDSLIFFMHFFTNTCIRLCLADVDRKLNICNKILKIDMLSDVEPYQEKQPRADGQLLSLPVRKSIIWKYPLKRSTSKSDLVRDIWYGMTAEKSLTPLI